MTDQEFGKIIERKHILLDTCFIIKALQYAGTGHFNNLFSLLQEKQCPLVINEFVRFEFLRGCQTKEQIRIKTSFLNALSEKSGFVMPIDQAVLDGAVDISNLYSNKRLDQKQISPVDCYLSGYLKKYSRNLILVTLNHADFPLLLHDRLFVYTIDAEKEIFIVGFYAFNETKFSKMLPDIR